MRYEWAIWMWYGWEFCHATLIFPVFFSIRSRGYSNRAMDSVLPTYFKRTKIPPRVDSIHYRGLDFCLAGHIGPTNTWSTEITTTFGQFLDWASLLTVKKKKVNNEAQTKINFGRKLCSIYVASEWIGGRGSRDVSPASFISLSTSEESIIWKLPSRQHKKVDHSSCQSFSMMVNSFCPCSHTAV